MQRLSLGSPAGRSFRLSVAADEEAEAADEKATKAEARAPAPDRSIHLVPVLTLLCLLVLFLLSHDPSAALTGMSPSPRRPPAHPNAPLSALANRPGGECCVARACRFARAGRGRHRHRRRTLLGGHRRWRRRRCVPKPEDLRPSPTTQASESFAALRCQLLTPVLSLFGCLRCSGRDDRVQRRVPPAAEGGPEAVPRAEAGDGAAAVTSAQRRRREASRWEDADDAAEEQRHFCCLLFSLSGSPFWWH